MSKKPRAILSKVWWAILIIWTILSTVAVYPLRENKDALFGICAVYGYGVALWLAFWYIGRLTRKALPLSKTNGWQRLAILLAGLWSLYKVPAVLVSMFGLAAGLMAGLPQVFGRMLLELPMSLAAWLLPIAGVHLCWLLLRLLAWPLIKGTGGWVAEGFKQKNTLAAQDTNSVEQKGEGYGTEQ